MELIDSLKETLSKRLKGVFGGSFILVWLVFNWKILYIIFNFDKDSTLTSKLIIIQKYIILNYPYRLLLYPIIFSIASIIVYNILDYISFSIITFFSLNVKPFILKRIDINEIVDRERYNILENQYIDLDRKFTSEKANFIKNADTIKELQIINDRLKIDINQLEFDKIEFDKKNIIEIDKLKNDYNSKLTKLESEIRTKESEIFNLKIDTVITEKTIEPSSLFIGNWEKSYKYYDKEKGKEQKGVENFKITGNDYLIKDKKYFRIEYVRLFDNNIFIEIKKISYENNGILINKLVKITDEHYIGIENDNTRIEYKRVYIY